MWTPIVDTDTRRIQDAWISYFFPSLDTLSLSPDQFAYWWRKAEYLLSQTKPIQIPPQQ